MYVLISLMMYIQCAFAIGLASADAVALRCDFVQATDDWVRAFRYRCFDAALLLHLKRHGNDPTFARRSPLQQHSVLS